MTRENQLSDLSASRDRCQGGIRPYSIRIQELKTMGHVSMLDSLNLNRETAVLALVYNKMGLLIGASPVDKTLLDAEKKGGEDSRIARLDVCAMFGLPQNIVDN